MKPIPSIKELQARVSSALKTSLDINDPKVKLVIDALSGVLAGEMKLLYLYLSDIQNNLFPDTADTAENGGELNRMGQIYLNRQPKPATDGVYTARVNGLANAVLRAGLTYKSNDDSNAPGFLFVLDAEYILTGTDDVVTLRSLNAGPEYLLNIGDSLTATEPLIGADQQVIIDDETTPPSASESTDVYRQNIISAIQLEPQGGAKTDYRLWAQDAQGVQRVYPYVKNGAAGVVQIYVEATTEDSIDSNGTPSGALLDEVEQVIEMDPDTTLDVNERGRKPIQVVLEVLPVSTKPVDVTIVGIEVDNTSIRNNIRNNLVDFLFNVRPYIGGADLPRDKNDVLTAVKMQSVVDDTIGNANSFIDFKLYVDGVELNTYTFDGGVIPYLRNVTYIN